MLVQKGQPLRLRLNEYLNLICHNDQRGKTPCSGWPEELKRQMCRETES